MNDQSEMITGTDLEARADEIADIIQNPGSSLVPMIEKAQLEQMVVTARTYKRVLSSCIDAITALARIDKLAAEECVYALPRGGKPIIGPSIRFAEIVKQCWGNCVVSSYITDFSREGGWIEAEARYIDLQTITETRQRVRIRITDKRGRVFSEDMIIVTGNAASAKAMRNAILAGVPRPVWRAGYEAALAIAIDHKGETFTETRDRALKLFSQFGVTADQVLGALGLRAVDDLTGEHVPVLRGMFGALKNGEETVESLFDPRKGRPFEAVKSPLSDDGDGQAAGSPQGSKPADTPATVPADPESLQAAKDEAVPAGAGEPEKAVTEPGNEAEYREHALQWFAAATSASALDERWKREKRMRAECEVGEFTINELVDARKARAAALKAAT